MSCPPCLFDRQLLPKPWGGSSLSSALGILLPDGEKIGESWEVYDGPEGSSKLRNSDVTLADLLREDAPSLLGEGVGMTPQGHFPLQLKFIDASEPLSVQVHPDQEQATAGGGCGKTESWVVLTASEDARILRDVKAGVDAAALTAVAGTGEIQGLLHSFVPRRGDVVHLPPGTIHSVGPGVVLYEIQTNSGLTCRLWDWGRPREMHLEAALTALRVEGSQQSTVTPRPVGEGKELLVDEHEFRLERWYVSVPVCFEPQDRFRILTVVKGHLALGWRSSGQCEPLQLRAGDTALVPAHLDAVYLSPIGDVTLLCVSPGER